MMIPEYDDVLQRLRGLGEVVNNIRPRLFGIFRKLVAGILLAGAILLVLGLFIWNIFRDKEWNTQALIVKAASAESVGAAIVFTVDIENTTDDDLTLSQDLKFSTAAKGNGALQDSYVTLLQEYFIPKHHIARVNIVQQQACSNGQTSKACYEANFGDAREIVFFDHGRKIEGHIPLPMTVPPRTILIPVPDNEGTPDGKYVPDSPTTP